MIDFEKTKLILASNSPRRSELLKQAGYEFEIIASNMDEQTSETEPALVVKDLSLQKATNVFNSIMKVVNLSLDAYEGVSLMIIGADTIVAKDNQIMGKPKDHNQAFDMLNLLQNNTHQVYTGVSIILYDFETKEKKVHSFHDCTDVEFYPMTDSEINSYMKQVTAMIKPEVTASKALSPYTLKESTAITIMLLDCRLQSCIMSWRKCK